MKFLLSSVLLAALSPSAFAETRCSDAWSGVTYLHKSYEGGVPPMPGMETNRIEIRVNGTLVSQSIVRENQAPELGPINPDFSEIKILAEKQEMSGYTKDFQARLTLSLNPENKAAVQGIELPWSGFVICHEEAFFRP